MSIAPDTLFDFDHVHTTTQVVEAAIASERRKTDELIRSARPRIDDLALAALEGDPRLPHERTFNSGLAFPTILRRSLMIAICSHTEHVLRRWCSLLQAEWALPKPGKRQPGQSDIEHLMLYQRDVAGLSLADFSTWPEWQTIDAYKLVRNVLAHKGGTVDDPSQQARIEAADLRGVTIDTMMPPFDGPTIHLEVGACPAAVAAAQRFFARLSAIVQQDPPASRQPPAP
jgi:hypothetical protein